MIAFLSSFTYVPVAGCDGLDYTDASPWKLCVHTTEGSYASAMSSYRANKSCPHVTVDLDAEVYVQHVPLDRAAYSLRNASGGTETNRDNVIQVEIVGYSREVANWDAVKYMRLAYDVFAPIMEAQPGIALAFPERGFFSVDGGYGLGAESRMSAAEWDLFSGILGHQHVPENTHWDPGPLDDKLLMALLTGNPNGDSGMAYFEKYADPEKGTEYIVSQKRDGKIVYRPFSQPRGDGKPMAGLAIVLAKWKSLGIVQEVK